ncbi:glycosyltransferase family 2 protein [Ectothiorhodospira mobilis]|uniref:glycosyltransferase family 2 protein n=1 Tax=Ectothiorhodospira mobilis TaxID=195064 RepID=UPI001905F6A9|nr:glycosyltransferase family A protein [Ectothiorhodospira mobilis]MBK1692970.1 hypothetical protein [Ectothiorhodospira mobilis]
MQPIAEEKERLSVSVIIPTYNDQNGLDRCLESISKQDFTLDQLEVIVVDNGSSPPIVVGNDFPFRINLIVCNTQGSYAARNAGARVATGDIFAFIDADCWPEPTWLSRGVRRVAMGRGEEIVGGEVLLASSNPPSAVALYQCVTGFGQEFNIREKGFSATANLFFTREIFEGVGPFDERLFSGGDREWCWRAGDHGLMLRFERNAVVYTFTRSRLSSAVRQARRVVAGRKMLQQLDMAHRGSKGLEKQRSAWQSIRWILSHPDLNRRDRWRVFSVAVIIRLATIAEGFRLALGGDAERR